MSSFIVNRAPVLTLWATVVAEQLGHPTDTALTLGRAVAGSAARIKARSIGREERKAGRDAETPRLRVEHVTKPIFLLGKEIRLLPNEDGELRAADGDRPSDPAGVHRYLAKAGSLTEVAHLLMAGNQPRTNRPPPQAVPAFAHWRPANRDRQTPQASQNDRPPPHPAAPADRKFIESLIAAKSAQAAE